MLGHHDVGQHVEVLLLPGYVESIEKKVHTGGLKEDRRAAIGRERERVGMALLVDANPPHIWIMMGGVVVTSSAHMEEHPGHVSGLPLQRLCFA